MSAPLWGSGAPARAALFAFTTDDRGWDESLLRWDLLGSLGHLAGLERARLVSARDGARLRSALRALARAAGAGRFAARPGDEDIHSAIERALTEKLGATGARIHAGRSRNDQIATALRLWLKNELLALHAGASALAGALLAFGTRHERTLWPGYTHTRAAMPSSAGQWAHACACGLIDSLESLPSLWTRLDRCPLGSGAGFGVPLALDPAVAARALGFAAPEPSPAAVQSGRGKLEADALYFAVQLGHDLARLCADVILYSGEEFALLQLPAGWATGSSLMPQKKNPDLFELARARCGEVEGELAAVLRLKANLTSGYHRDFQRLKAPLIRGLATMRGAVAAVAAALPDLRVDPRASARLEGAILATDAALARCERGVPFRLAYRAVSAELSSGAFAENPSPARLLARRRAPGGLGNLGLARANARLRATGGWRAREARRFSSAMAKLSGR